MSMLVICDQPAELEAMLQLAAAAGLHDVIGFGHPASALDWCESNVPDLVMVDFLMRASDGLEVIRRMRANPALAGVPLVLMLPHGFESVSAAAWQQGATDFLAKPVDPTEFVARARNLRALRQARLAYDQSLEDWRAVPARLVTPAHVH